MKTFKVSVNFAGYIGADEEYEVDAENEELAEDEAIDAAKNDLTVDSVEETDDGYEVEIGFCGMIGVSEIYEISSDEADDQDEAEDIALQQAEWDLNPEVIGELSDLEDFEDIDEDDEDTDDFA